ncbi:MAG: peptidoglycan-binding domain-containing protein [Candidatus Nomurabacteria bacterium]|nr:peptidoglycan-binding domain-containing protein [Candidatus Nomurabacteria bacterium]
MNKNNIKKWHILAIVLGGFFLFLILIVNGSIKVYATDSYSFTGPSQGSVNTASTDFTITPDNLYTGDISINVSGGGLSTTITKTFLNSSAPQTFTIIPTIATSSVVLTPSNNGGLINPGELYYGMQANLYTITGPSSGTVNVPVTFTIVPNGFSYEGSTVVITPSGGGLSDPINIDMINYDSQTFTITPTATGRLTLSMTNNQDATNSADFHYTVKPVHSSGGGGGGSYIDNTFTLPSAPVQEIIPIPEPVLTPTIAPVLNDYTSDFLFRVLIEGTVGDDVRYLQTYLNTHGYPVALTGPGSTGNEITRFGKLTKNAVIKFQKDNGLPAFGIVGKMTRGIMKW